MWAVLAFKVIEIGFIKSKLMNAAIFFAPTILVLSGTTLRVTFV